MCLRANIFFLSHITLYTSNYKSTTCYIKPVICYTFMYDYSKNMMWRHVDWSNVGFFLLWRFISLDIRYDQSIWIIRDLSMLLNGTTIGICLIILTYWRLINVLLLCIWKNLLKWIAECSDNIFRYCFRRTFLSSIYISKISCFSSFSSDDFYGIIIGLLWNDG